MKNLKVIRELEGKFLCKIFSKTGLTNKIVYLDRQQLEKYNNRIYLNCAI